MALEAFLVSQVSLGKRCLLVVDEAQNLTLKAVEELRMLSNFQFGQQALLQTFLVGQPEFRAILQSPDMQQLRQRVTATCHIGPLDRDETQGYIEHRLKCAGALGRPGFDAPAFDAIFQASGGIPRRVNLLCDRLLLLGFLGNKADFTAQDVNEVVSEMKAEATPPSAPAPRPVDWAGVSTEAPESPDLPEIVLERIQVTPGLAEALSSQMDTLGLEQYDGRLRRLERSMLRLERINLESLVMLKKLVLAAGARPQESRL